MWKYWEVATEGTTVLVNVALGAISVRTWMRPQHIGALNALVFRVLLPAAVIRVLGIKTDLYDSDIWRFVGAFLILRVFALVLVCAAAAIRQRTMRQTSALHEAWVGNLVVDWLGLSWISTIVLGVPMLKVALGPASATYPVYASISSFVFQLPVMLALLELHTWYCTRYVLPVSCPAKEPDFGPNIKDGHEVLDSHTADHHGSEKPSPAGSERAPPEVRRERLLRTLRTKILQNNVLWGILVAFVLSLSTLGPTYLDPGDPKAPNNDFVKGLAWIDEVLNWLGSQCLTPVALFATGMWMASGRTDPNDLLATAEGAPRDPAKPVTWRMWPRTIVILALKFTIIPMLMIPIAKWLDLDNVAARAAVLIAILPIAPAAFTLSEEYGIGQTIMTRCITIGTVLMVPTMIIFLEVMDSTDLFNVPPVPKVPATG